MLYKIEKKLLDFYTSGDSAESFFAGRRVKTAKFRRVIRACFYLHCIAAIACIALSALFSAGFDIVKISVCALTAVIFAFFAVGDLDHVKTISCVIDFAFAAGAFITGALGAHRTLYLICGGIMCLLGFSMIVSAVAAACKRFLENAAPYRTSIPSEEYDDIPDLPEEYRLNLLTAQEEEPQELIPPPPTPPLPPSSKMRELAGQVYEIICSETEKNEM